MARPMQMDQRQFYEHLYNSLMTNKDQVNEKILTLTLEIIFLLTGENCIIVKKRSDHVTDSSSPSESEGLCRTQSPVLDHPLNSLTHEGHNDKKILHPPSDEVPVRCEDVAVYLSMEEWVYLEEHKEHYKEVMGKNPQLISSQGCRNVNLEEHIERERDSELSVTDHQDPQETVHPDTCADESSNRNTPERRPISPYPQDRTEEDNGFTQEWQMDPGAVIFPQPCKEEEIPTDISTDAECMLNNSFTQNDEGPKLVGDISSNETLRNCDTMLDTDGTVHKESNTTDLEIEQTGADYFQSLINMCTKGKKKDLGPVSYQKIHREKTFWGSECGKSFTSSSDIDAHQINHTGVKPCVSSDCAKCFTKTSHPVVRQTEHTGKKQFKCSVCGNTFSSSSYLVIHQRIHTGEKPFICFKCGKGFSRSSNLFAHQRSHTGEKPFKCSECEKSFTRHTQLVIHTRSHTGEKPFKCNVCGKSFTSSSKCVFHQRTHTAEKPYKCSECGKSFITSSEFNIHQRRHTGEKPFMCCECGKSFATSSTLTKHQRCHTGAKPFICSECGRGFSNSSNLFAHQRIHTGEKPFKCSECDKSFARHTQLVTHKRNHTGEKPFKCNVCGKSFSRDSSYYNHQKVHLSKT